MFEHRSKPLLPWPDFVLRLTTSIVVGLALVAVSLGLGMVGYHHYEGMAWVDAFANAAMILSGMGPLAPLNSEDGKLFAGFYALYSGLLVVVAVGIVLAPILHRFLHRFHVDVDGDG